MKLLSVLLCLLLLSGCGSETPEKTAPVTALSPISKETFPLPQETEPADPIRLMLNDMSLEERVGQLFLARCNDDYALEHIATYHLGGFVLFQQDFRNETPGDSAQKKFARYQAAAKIPLLLAVDEEGGTVTRVSSLPYYREKRFASPRQLYKGGGMEWILYEENEKCALLKDLGLNVNLAPVVDIATERNAFMYDRSLGQDAQITADFAVNVVTLMDSWQLGSCLKHFPGYGNNLDTHTGIAVDGRSLAELESKDLLPFAAGIQAGCDAILISHTIVTALDDSLPASLSPAVHEYLRNTMGFEGVIVTDDLVMQAITDAYGAEEAAVLAVLAGNDLLCSTQYQVQYDAVLGAVESGRISAALLDSAVTRVLTWKKDLGLIF